MEAFPYNGSIDDSSGNFEHEFALNFPGLTRLPVYTPNSGIAWTNFSETIPLYSSLSGITNPLPVLMDIAPVFALQAIIQGFIDEFVLDKLDSLFGSTTIAVVTYDTTLGSKDITVDDITHLEVGQRLQQQSSLSFPHNTIIESIAQNKVVSLSEPALSTDTNCIGGFTNQGRPGLSNLIGRIIEPFGLNLSCNRC